MADIMILQTWGGQSLLQPRCHARAALHSCGTAGAPLIGLKPIHTPYDLAQYSFIPLRQARRGTYTELNVSSEFILTRLRRRTLRMKLPAHNDMYVD